jgi:hypothetical protein
LEWIRLELGHQPNASAFLQFVEQNARAGLGNHGECHLQLLAAIATDRSKDITGETLRVYAHQRRRCMDVPHHQGDSFFSAAVADGRIMTELAFKTHNAEEPPARGEIGFGQLVQNELGTHKSIIDGMPVRSGRH